MFMDVISPGGPGGEGPAFACHGCRKVFAHKEAVERIEFDASDEPKLRELNGAYHPDCAKPILSMKRAYDMLKRAFG